jgi:cellobiose-specific phosphotransferase system component IIC
MSEYELVDTFYKIAALSDQLMASFITLLFAFLVASYLVSSKLDSRMTGVVVALYSFMAIRYVVLYSNVTGDISTLADTLTELRAGESSSLDWLEIQGGIWWVNVGTTIAMFLGYLASIFFFFYTRHRGDE